jgi:acyl transferase domain-containing protein
MVFMFSGQGSQFFRMGRDLFEHNPVFRDWMQRLDEAARPAIGASVLATLYDPARGKGDAFDRTLLTHPAIYMTEIALAQALIADGVIPDRVLGVSLGSFAAAAIGGYVAIEDGLQAVIRQASALETLCPPGGMIAIMASPALYDESWLRDRSALAGVNFDRHFTVTAGRHDLDAIEAELKRREIAYVRLPVSVPFHSAAIDPARDSYLSAISALPRRRGVLPLVCCDRATVLDAVPETFFWDIARNPMRFGDAIRHLETGGPWRYVDVGPSGTLATFLKYILPKDSRSSMLPVLTPFGSDVRNYDAVLAATDASGTVAGI